MIEECYFLICNCGDRIRDSEGQLVQCDCPRKTKRPVMIASGCDYCATRSALHAAALAVASDPDMRAAFREYDEPEAPMPARMILPPLELDLELDAAQTEMDSTCPTSVTETGGDWQTPTRIRASSPD